MALTAAEITLCNAALMRTGQSLTIAADGESTNQYRVANALYSIARDYVLAARDWEFATKRAALAGKATSTSTLWAYSYTYPTDCIKARRILGAAASPRRDEKIPFQVLNTGTALVILTNEDTASLEYTVAVSDPTLFDPIFYSAVAYYLASEMAMALKASPEIAKGALDAYMALVKQASENAYEGMPETTISYYDGATLTSTVICNMALARIGYKSLIASLTETTDAARGCALFYPRVLAEMMRNFSWTFSTARATLVAASGDPPTNWGYKYLTPTDCVFVQGIVNPLGRRVTFVNDIPYECATETISAAATRVIYTNEPTAELLYTTSTFSNPTSWPADFTNAFIWKLASELILLLGLDARLIQICQQNYFMAISAARARAYNEGNDGPEPDCDFITGRA